MKRIWKIVVIPIIVILIVIQFIRPEKNDKLVNPENDIALHLRVPSDIRKKLVDACYDCHSNKTKYPFYNDIAPVSWILASHVKEGKEHLNFSEWAAYDNRDQAELLDEICEVTTNGEMPLKSYTLMHRSAAIDPGQLEAICAWTEQAREETLGMLPRPTGIGTRAPVVSHLRKPKKN